MAVEFVHHHVHTDFSMLDGAAKVSAAVAEAHRDGARALSITDHGSPAGIIQLAKECGKYGMTPIPGFEAYHVPSFERAREQKAEDGKSRFHLTLLGVNEAGYRNVIKLSSKANTEQYYYKGLVDDALLAKHTEGIVATSSCLGSRYNQLLLNDRERDAVELLARYRDMYRDGGGHFFIEVQDHGIPDQDRVTPFHLKHARDLGIPLLATNDSHYISQSDAAMHDALLCMQTKSQLADEDRFRFSSDQNHMRTAREMYDLFPEDRFPDACTNTLLIAEMATGMGSIILPKGKYLIPTFPLPSGWTDAAEYLRHLVLKGAMVRYGSGGRIPTSVMETIDYQLQVIHEMGFDDYFLVVWDLVRYAKEEADCAVGPGRGSAAGCIVTYCLNITTLDPIHHGLIFERFLNPGRKSMPDVDIDFEPDKRHLIRSYAARVYGDERVAYIATYGEMKGKSAMKSAARVLGKPVAVGNALSAVFPNQTANGQITLRGTMGARDSVAERFQKSWDEGSILRAKYKKDAEAKEIIDLAMSVEGIYQQTGLHAAAVLITPGPLHDYVPIRRSTDGDLFVSEYDKDDAEAIGGLKMDLLGLINLSVIKRAVELIKRDLGKTIDIDNIPLDDPKVYDLLSRGETDGVFQLEGGGMRDLLRRVQPTEFEDISAVLALYRPGPMGSELHYMFADVKNGRAKATAPHRDILEICADSKGVLTYQEQLIQMARHYAGMDATQGDNFRKAVGKKDADALAEQESVFKSMSVANGYDAKTVDRIWDMIPPFAAYAFNKAHSASYGMITYQTAWLKANYLTQYVAASIDYLSTDRVSAQVEYARSEGVKVYAPDINKSFEGATTEGAAIWLGLGGISNCGGSTLTNIFAVRRSGGPFRSLSDFLVRTDGHRINKTAITKLIQAGAFDHLHGSRLAMCENLEEMTGAVRGAGRKMDAIDTADDLFGDLEADDAVTSAEKSFDLDGEDYGTSERLRLEVEALGFFAGTHPFSLAEPHLDAARSRGLLPTESVVVGDDSIREGAKATIVGVIANLSVSTTKNGRQLTKFMLETGRGPRIECVMFATLFGAQAGSIAWVQGLVKEDEQRGGEDDNGPLTVMVNEAKAIPLETIIGRSNAPAPANVVDLDSRRRGREESRREESRRESGDRPRRSRGASDDPPAPRRSRGAAAVAEESYVEPAGDFMRFRVGSEAQMREFTSQLRNVGYGRVRVAIIYQGVEVKIDQMSFDLDESAAVVLASRTGAKLILD